jgi:hypothetical protein
MVDRRTRPTIGGQCHSGPEHTAEVLATMVETGAWSVDDVAERVGLSAAELRDYLGGASSPGEGMVCNV